MINGWLVVLQKTAALFLIMILGWIAAKRNLWNPQTGRTISRLLLDFIVPFFILSHLLQTVNPAILHQSWYIPLLGFAVIALGQLVGLAGSPFVRNPSRRRTFIFLVSLTNWIYLPLPIAKALYGKKGVDAILLMNVGCTAAIWTIGIATLNPGLTPRESFKHVAGNPSILATVAGLALVLAVPSLCQGAPSHPFIQPLLTAADLLGSLMIPLSLLVIGAQLAESTRDQLRPEPALWGVLALRLAAAPLLALLLVRGLALAGWPIPDAPRFAFLLVAAMPPALSCTLFTERYNGDSRLSAKAVFIGTFASLATVPLFVRLVQALGW